MMQTHGVSLDTDVDADNSATGQNQLTKYGADTYLA